MAGTKIGVAFNVCVGLCINTATGGPLRTVSLISRVVCALNKATIRRVYLHYA